MHWYHTFWGRRLGRSRGNGRVLLQEARPAGAAGAAPDARSAPGISACRRSVRLVLGELLQSVSKITTGRGRMKTEVVVSDRVVVVTRPDGTTAEFTIQGLPQDFLRSLLTCRPS